MRVFWIKYNAFQYTFRPVFPLLLILKVAHAFTVEFWQLKANEVEVNVTNFDSLFLYVTLKPIILLWVSFQGHDEPLKITKTLFIILLNSLDFWSSKTMTSILLLSVVLLKPIYATTFRIIFLLFVSICVPPNNPTTACGVTSLPDFQSFPKWAMGKCL